MDLALTSPDLAQLGRVVAGYLPASSGVRRRGRAHRHPLLKRALINCLELDFANDAARFAATYDEWVYDNPSPISWMRQHCRMTSTAAAAAICVGEQAARLEQSMAALMEGRLGFAQLTLIASTADAIEHSPSAHHHHESRQSD